MNRERIEGRDLASRLSALLAGRGDRAVFFDAEAGVGYGDATDVLDILNALGARIAVASSAERPSTRGKTRR